MAHNIRFKGYGSNIYSSDGTKSIFGKMPGYNTASRVVLNATPLEIKDEFGLKYVEQGYTPEQANAQHNSLRARPVYALRARAGKIALMFGPAGATDLSPANAVWFRKSLMRPKSPILRSICDMSKAAAFSVTDAQIQWSNGQHMTSGTPSVTPDELLFQLDSDQLSLWRARRLLGGVCHVTRVGANFRTATYKLLASSGLAGSAYIVNNRHQNGHWYQNFAIAPESAVSAVGVATYTAVQLGGVDLWKTVDLLYGGWELAPVDCYTATDARMEETVPLAAADFAALDAARTLFGDYTPSNRYGSVWPFPLSSQRLCYAHGLPVDCDIIVWEGEVRSNANGEIKFALDYLSADVTAATYKKMYPVSSLPADKRSTAARAFDELNDDVSFRVALFTAGLSYVDGIDYEGTELAKDLLASGSTLDALQFDNIEDGKPAIGYGSLGAKSLVAIEKRRNVATAICLATSGTDLVSLAPLEFEMVGDGIQCFQSGTAIDVGQATIAMRTGAPVVFTYVTQEQVATSFFKMPSWSSVVGFEAEAQSHEYIVDENILSNELLFDLATADERARVLPLLLGIERNDFAFSVGSVLMGTSVQEVV